MALKRERSDSPTLPSDIYRSSSVKEKDSVFVAAFSPTLSVKALQSLPEFKTAHHRIAAWRKESRQRTLMPRTEKIYDLGHHDDGEKWAGSRLQHVLGDTQAEGVVVVARWFGGELLGPLRFTLIENCAKEAIWNWKEADQAAQKETAAKKRKLEEEKARKGLEENLRERDLNIFVLRKLLADKNAKLNDSEPAPPTPQKPVDYGKMSMEALQRVDKARDATITFILKEIDKVDEQLKLVEAFDDSTQDSWKDAEEHQRPTDRESEPTKEDS
ncbi:hypothetical protein BU26DRAFT_600884 [Trematosphaeria pertusa]|uniref:Impact N-terminal domain-containing protein n=1 Tax=Trematosphaeria pertusa TaxID=390896 RepID=A0A6A6IY03_9PLEO|nr:uncharacterized protein BU26DRAFT_600884 [Trematosphaeria pertusa]KAF2255369.1 hypothetical protein BU26DRAFT_600884 [Trematosphaeria pertusa]